MPDEGPKKIPAELPQRGGYVRKKHHVMISEAPVCELPFVGGRKKAMLAKKQTPILIGACVSGAAGIIFVASDHQIIAGIWFVVALVLFIVSARIHSNLPGR